MRTLSIGKAMRIRFELSGVIATVGLLGASALLALLILGTGPLPVAPGQVFAVLAGEGSAYERFALMELGLPRIAAALCVGAALGVGGSLIQSLTRNPLGSPDIIGFNSGAAAGAVAALLVFKLDARTAMPIAIMAGLLTALLVFWASNSKAGFDNGYRLILVGIGVSAALAGLNSFLVTRSRVEDAKEANRWLAGSLNDAHWESTTVVFLALLVILPLSIVLARQLRILELGEEAATSLGIKVPALAVIVLVVAVAVSAAGISAAGPIPFVALAAPQLAKSLTKQAAVSPLPSAAMGAFLLIFSDFLAQRVFPLGDLPVGVVTGVVGGLYLMWILTRQWKARR